MRIFNYLSLAILMIISSKLPGQNKKERSTRPNIVLLFIDDWAWNGTSVRMDESMPNSKMPLLQMPNLEKLASQGIKFRNAYSAAPQCSPSRVSLQTGKSAPNSGFTVYINNGGSEYYDPNPEYGRFPVIPCVSDMTIDNDAVTIPEALNPLGYVCAHIGKWHMRGDPGKEGYAVHDGATDNKEGNQDIPGDPKLMFSMTEKGIKFMEEQVNKGNPFYLQLSYYAMHAGYECLEETREKYTRMPEIQEFYRKLGRTEKTIPRRHADPATWMGMGEDMDGRIGAVLDQIKELGIEENTYVVLTSDNGYRHAFDLGSPQPLHGGKWWIWQGGIRVPMIAKGPGIQPGSVCNENVINYDFLPTFVDWAGGKSGGLKDIDGISLAGIMRGEKVSDEFHNRYLYFHYPHYRESMPSSAIVSGNRKVMHFYEAPGIPMLFDLAVNEGEVENIALLKKDEHDRLYNQMMQYLQKRGARIPMKNPDYQPAAYQKAKDYTTRMMWGPFEGTRSPEEDEK
jgi:arylsulfatase A